MPPLVEPHTMVALMAGVVGTNHDHIDRYKQFSGAGMVGGMLDDEEGIRRTFPLLDAFASLSVSEAEHQVIAIALQLKIGAQKICLTIAENGPVKQSLPGHLKRLWVMLQQLGREFATHRLKGENPDQWRNFKGQSPGMPVDVGRDRQLAIFKYVYDYAQIKNRSRTEKWLPRLTLFIRELEAVRGGNLIGLENELKTAFRALNCAHNVYDVKTTVGNKDIEHWRELYALLEGATRRVQCLTQDHNGFCENLASSIASDPTKIFHLRHALKKLTSQHDHIQNLIYFAHSPRLQDALQCQLEIVSVPSPQPSMVQLPETVAEWREVIHEIAKDFYKFGATWPTKEAEELHRKYSNQQLCSEIHPPSQPTNQKFSHSLTHAKSFGILQSQSHDHWKRIFHRKSQSDVRSKYPLQSESEPSAPNTPTGVHCECALIQFLAHQRKGFAIRDLSSVKRSENKEDHGGWKIVVKKSRSKWGRRKVEEGKEGGQGSYSGSPTENWGGVPAFTYITVSKLSCAPCQLWIEGYNSLPGPSFYTRGNHGKWYWPWMMPELNKEHLGAGIVDKISVAYLNYCRSKHRLRKLSDGSTSGSGNKPKPLDPEVENLMEALLLANPSM